jgi:hypothetical protein
LIPAQQVEVLGGAALEVMADRASTAQEAQEGQDGRLQHCSAVVHMLEEEEEEVASPRDRQQLEGLVGPAVAERVATSTPTERTARPTRVVVAVVVVPTALAAMGATAVQASLFSSGRSDRPVGATHADPDR